MKSFEINDDGDWTLDMVEGDLELIQSLKHLLSTRVGEWFLNEDYGFLVGVLEEKHYSESQIVQSIYDAIYQEPRVIEIIKVEYNFDRVKRNLVIDFNLRTINGETGGEIDVDIGRLQT